MCAVPITSLQQARKFNVTWSIWKSEDFSTKGQEQTFILADLTTQASPHHKSKGTGHFTNMSRMSIVVKTNDEKACKEH